MNERDHRSRMCVVLMDWFVPKTPVMLGIDISSATIKLLELSICTSGLKVENFAIEPLPENAVVEREIKDIEAVGRALNTLVKRTKSKIKFAAVAIAGAAVITKTLEVAAGLTDSEIESQITLEADRYIPYPLEEVSLDFTNMGPSKTNATQAEVLLVATRTENIDSRVEVLAQAGLLAKVVDTEPFAFERAYTLIASQIPSQGKNQTVAIFDIGSSISTLLVLHDGKTFYTRDQLFGGKQLTEEIQRRYGLTYQEAILVKKQGGLPEDYQTEVLEPFIDTLVQQVSRALQFFFSSTNDVEINHMIFSGGTAMLPGLMEKIEKELGSPASIANPFINMQIAPKVNASVLLEEAPSLMICCGLAMRSFKL